MATCAGAIGGPKAELDTPALIVDLDAMDRNTERMSRTIIREAGLAWRPHIKCAKVPALAHRLLAAGAIGVTCAKLGEAEVMAAAGLRDILIANQIVGQHKIARLMQLQRQADVAVAVDDSRNVDELDRAAREIGVRPRVLIEVEVGMQRAGVEPGEAVLALARQIATRPGLRFAGLMTFEAHALGIADPATKRIAVEQALRSVVESADLCRAAGLPVEIVSCGGTGTYTDAVGVPGITEIQAGGGIFSDLHYRRDYGVDLELALTVLSTVTSRPTSRRIVCDAGRKAMSTYGAIPEPIGITDVQSVAVHGEHAVVELTVPNHKLAPGDSVEFAVGHADLTVHLHDELYSVRNERVEAAWPIWARAAFR